MTDRGVRDARASRVEFVEGVHVENGWISPYMVSDRTRMETVFEDPYILMTTKPISHAQDLLPALDQVMKAPRPLVILAEKVDGSALGMLVANNQHQTLRGRRGARAGLRPPAHPPPRRPRRLHRRPGHRRGGRADARPREAPSRFGRARRVDRHRGLDDVHRGRRARARRSRRGCTRSAPSSARATHDRDVEVLAGAPGAAGARRSPSSASGRRPRSCSTSACAAPRARSRRRRRRCPRASSRAAAPRCCAARRRSTRSAQEGEYGRGVDVVRTVLERAAVLDRLERRLRRPGDDRPGQGDARRPRPRRADRRVRRPVREGRRSTRSA